MYFVGVQEDNLALIQRAASDEFLHGGALHYLALHNYNSENGGGDQQEFAKMLFKAADVGNNAESMALIAECYFHGSDGFTRCVLRSKEQRYFVLCSLLAVVDSFPLLCLLALFYFFSKNLLNFSPGITSKRWIGG